jgi:hypothetical protein
MDMNTVHAEIRMRVARGDSFSGEELLLVAQHIESINRRCTDYIQKTQQLEAKVGVLEAMNTLAFAAAGQARTIDEITEEVLAEGTNRNSQLYNAFEIRQFVYALQHNDERYNTLKVAYDQIDVETSPARSVKQIMDAINNDVIGPFSFKEVHAWTEYLRNHSGLNRPMKNNVREVFQLLKAQPHAQFYGQEVKMVREWGTDHDRNLSIVKARLGRAFTDPVGYMDTRFDLMLTRGQKRELLDGRVLLAQGYQHAVFARPDFLQIDKDWAIGNEKTQFHAGEHWHTDSSGKWWCGSNFARLTARELMTHLETTLGELRLLYIHFPNGVPNEEPVE